MPKPPDPFTKPGFTPKQLADAEERAQKQAELGAMRVSMAQTAAEIKAREDEWLARLRPSFGVTIVRAKEFETNIGGGMIQVVAGTQQQDAPESLKRLQLTVIASHPEYADGEQLRQSPYKPGDEVIHWRLRRKLFSYVWMPRGICFALTADLACVVEPAIPAAEGQA